MLSVETIYVNWNYMFVRPYMFVWLYFCMLLLLCNNSACQDWTFISLPLIVCFNMMSTFLENFFIISLKTTNKNTHPFILITSNTTLPCKGKIKFLFYQFCVSESSFGMCVCTHTAFYVHRNIIHIFLICRRHHPY